MKTNRLEELWNVNWKDYEKGTTKIKMDGVGEDLSQLAWWKVAMVTE